MRTDSRALLLALGLGLLAGCGQETGKSSGKTLIVLYVGQLDVANARERKQGIEEVLKGTGVEIAETFTDQTERSKCQEYVRTALDKYGDDLKCLVGLWSYNAPCIVQVLKEKGLSGKIKVVAFDEEIPTLDAVEEGIIESTIVQQPYEFGYKSIEVLSKLARGEKVEIPKDGLMYVPVKVIDNAGVKSFRDNVQKMLSDAREGGSAGEGKKLQIAFVTNNSSEFWLLAKAGTRKAEKDFDVRVDFQIPGQGTAAQQQQIIETLIAKGVDGMAVSVLTSEGATSIIDEAAKHMPVVTQDSDAPDSKRKAYVGTNNVEAGRVAAREILKALGKSASPPKQGP